MNVSTPARKVRRHIFMLASIGAASFAAYLAVVSTIAVRNEQRLENIVQVKQPLIEHLRASEQALAGFKTDLTNAISLEDPYLIEDAEALAREFASHLRAAEGLASQRREDITQLITDFERYRQQALSTSRILVDDPGEAYRRQEEVAAFNNGHEALLARMSALINTKIGEYATELGNARQGMEETRLWGLFLGSMTIMLLLGLTVPFSRNAMAAITRSDRMKDEFLSTISHELRTPMNGIMGAINLLRGTDVSPAQQQLIDAASSSSSDMLLAVNDILEFSDFLTGNISQHARDFTLNAIIDDVILKYRQECERKGLALHLRMPDKPWLCHGDADHITHVLRHLLGNAVKFTQTGSVTVTVDVVAGSTFSQLAITVRDTGPGVPAHQIEEIFKPFQQLDGSYTRQYGGLGIGLPICRRIATALNGTLDFANHPEGGIEVRLTAPIEAHIQEHPVLSNAGADAPANAMVFAESLHVLVVEDNKVNQMVINGYLKRMGCTAQTANNGQEALEKLARDHFDVILMDCQMPVMDGFEATRAIRGLGDEKRARLPIIAVTANVMEGDRERCFDSGMDDYLPKPVDMLALKAAIERNLKPQRAA